QQSAENEDREQPVAAEDPADSTEHRARAEQEQPDLQQITGAKQRPGHRALPLVVFQTPWRPRPVRLRRVAPARAVERWNVLKRDEDMAVELHVRHVLNHAVRRQRPFLVVAAEQRDLDLLAFVLARVVLHRSQRTASPRGSMLWLSPEPARSRPRVVPENLGTPHDHLATTPPPPTHPPPPL